MEKKNMNMNESNFDDEICRRLRPAYKKLMLRLEKCHAQMVLILSRPI